MSGTPGCGWDDTDYIWAIANRTTTPKQRIRELPEEFMSRPLTSEELEEIAAMLREEINPVMAALGRSVPVPSESYGLMASGRIGPAERLRLRKALDAAHESRR